MIARAVAAFCLLTTSAAAQSLEGDVNHAVSLPPGVSQPAPIGKAVLGGKVVNAKTGEPIKKAQVALNGPANLNAVTDGSGSFTFRALPAGAYIVSANREDFFQPAGGMNSSQVTLAEDGDKEDVEIKLMPGAVISGRILDEDDLPVAQCSVSAMWFDFSQRVPRLFNRGGASTDDEGRYRMHSLQPGRYVLKAHCTTTFAAPHGFMKRTDPAIPHEGYGPVFSGAAGAAGAPSALSGIPVAAGTELSSIDFHVKRIPVFSVIGTISGVDQNLLSGAQVMLIPSDSPVGDDNLMTATLEPHRGRYVFSNVPAGSYELIATVFNNDHAYEGRQNIEVGKTQLTEFELKLNSGSPVSGLLETDDTATHFDNMQISLQPLSTAYHGPYPQAALNADGSFQFKAVLPGHFRLNPLPLGYIKALAVAGRDVSPDDFEIDGETSLHIRIGTKMGQVDVAVTPKTSGGQPISALLIPENASGNPELAMGAGDSDLSFGRVAPGKYRVVAIASGNAWNLMNQKSVLELLRSQGAEVEVTEGSTKHVSASLVSAEDLEKALDAAQ